MTGGKAYTRGTTYIEYENLCAANAAASALGAACTAVDECTDVNAICSPTTFSYCECKTGYIEYNGVCGKCTLHCEMIATRHCYTEPSFIIIL